MAKGFKAGAGGGASLNFKVVGGTSAPSNPKENTLWVNTDVPIDGWCFDHTQPENMTEGGAWFFTSEASNVAFNALKKNDLRVYPMSVKQYVSGAWVDKTAKIYQGGAWKDWTVYIYNLGWISASGFDIKGTDGSAQIEVGYSNGYLVLRCSTTPGWSLAQTKETYDLTNVNTLYCETGAWDENYGEPIRFGVGTVDTVRIPTAHVRCDEPNTVYALDVSSLSGKYNIGFYCYNDDYYSAYWIPKTIKAFWY